MRSMLVRKIGPFSFSSIRSCWLVEAKGEIIEIIDRATEAQAAITNHFRRTREQRSLNAVLILSGESSCETAGDARAKRRSPAYFSPGFFASGERRRSDLPPVEAQAT